MGAGPGPRALTDSPVEVVPDLREHERAATPWFDDPAEWRQVVTRMFRRPDESALPGWEPLARGPRPGRPGGPDVEWWASLGLPDHRVIEIA